jgi:hypothetical protein
MLAAGRRLGEPAVKRLVRERNSGGVWGNREVPSTDTR